MGGLTIQGPLVSKSIEAVIMVINYSIQEEHDSVLNLQSIAKSVIMVIIYTCNTEMRRYKLEQCEDNIMTKHRE